MANGKSDIKLLDDFDGQVKVEAPDFCVDGGPGRRNGSTTPYRRAFVHADDGLTINWANDYTGGVTINGVKTITGHKGQLFAGVTIEGGMDISLNALALLFKGNSIILNCQPPQPEGVKITGNVQFDGTVRFKAKLSPGVIAPPGWTPPYYDLADEIGNLKNRVAALEKKVP